MIIFWRIRKGLSKLRLSILEFFTLSYDDVIFYIKYIYFRFFCDLIFNTKKSKEFLESFNLQKNLHFRSDFSNSGCGKTKPVIFISACENEIKTGDAKFNGGVHEYNNLVKLLRMKSYEAYIVTYDGTYQPWLFEHQPHISLKEFITLSKELPNIRCVTSWIVAKSFIDACEKIYFWDMELHYTDNEHFSTLAKLFRKKIVHTATISRTMQAWYMATFRKSCYLLPNLIDDFYWHPNPDIRIFNRVGYMIEGSHTISYINHIKNEVSKSGLDLDFFQIKGDNYELLNGMQSCNIFLSLNIGKDILWGEGCPRTIIEALSTGAVVIGFDIIGNKEILIDSFNGIIVPRYQVDLMAKSIIELFNNPTKIDILRENGLKLFQSCYTLERRWPAVKEFLDLNDFD